MKYIRILFLSLLLISTIFISDFTAKADTESNFTVDKISYEIIDTTTHSVRVVGFSDSLNSETISIPNTVQYNQTDYTVTELIYDSLSATYPSVKEIIVPNTLTGKFIIKNSYITEHEYNTNGDDNPKPMPFPNLSKITFLGDTSPTEISVMSYLNGSDMVYHVPSGSEIAYALVSKPYKYATLGWLDRIDGDSTYITYDIDPVIYSDQISNPEPHLFTTEYGVYVVTNSASNGNGTVTLVKALNLIRTYQYKTPDSGYFTYPNWDDYTIETTAAYNNEYQYTVTTLGQGSLLQQKPTMLTIPDTITKMDTHCINSAELKFLFLSKNCLTISDSIFNGGEEDDEICLIYVPDGVKKISSNAFSSVRGGTLMLSKGTNITKSSISKRFDSVTYYQKKSSDILATGLKVPASKISVSISTTKNIGITTKNKKSTEKIHYISMDNSTAKISSSGKITPKHQGTNYIVAVSELTGQHALIQVKVKDKTFKSGIFTYRINYDTKNTVTIIDCTPKKSTTTLTFPSTVKYNKKTYTVTQVMAGKSIIDRDQHYLYTAKKGYKRTYDYETPLIKDSIAANLKITKVVYPSSISMQVSNLGNLKSLKKIVFKGSKAPSLISLPENTFKKAKIYVPKKYLSSYKNTSWRYGSNTEYTYYHKWNKGSIIRFITY